MDVCMYACAVKRAYVDEIEVMVALLFQCHYYTYSEPILITCGFVICHCSCHSRVQLRRAHDIISEAMATGAVLYDDGHDGIGGHS